MVMLGLLGEEEVVEKGLENGRMGNVAFRITMAIIMIKRNVITFFPKPQ